MNGVAALCHFCELHGPSVVFCTQAFHTDSPAFEAAIADSAPNAQPGSVPPSRRNSGIPVIPDDALSPSRPPSRVGAHDDALAPSTPTAPSSSAAHADRSASCLSCSALGEGERGFVTHEAAARTSYVSSRFPSNPQVYAMVRQACVRSLSCEFASGREGPLFFGDDVGGYALSYMFRLKDAQARGMLRWYCFTVLMLDQIFLAASWPFLVTNMRVIVADMQARASRVMERELSLRKRSEASPGGVHRSHSGRSMLSSDAFLRRVGGTTTPRSLADIVGVPDYLAHVHACLAWLLRACGNRLFEKHLTSGGVEPLMPLAGAAEADDGDGKAAPDRSSDGERSPTALSSSSLALGGEEGRSGAVVGEGLAVDSLVELRRLVRPDGFNQLVFNVSVGNQVIVRAASRSLVCSVLALLQALLPSACVTAMPYEPVYRDAWQCNFLGLRADAEVPAHVDRGSYAMLDVKYDAFDDVAPAQAAVGDRGAQDRFTHFMFVVTGGPTRLRAPSMSSRRAELPPSVVSLDGWNTFAAQVDALMLLQPSARMLATHIMALREEWVAKAKLLFKLIRGSTSDETEEKLRRFLRVLNLRESDLPMLRFWTTGLSKAHRAELLGAATQPPPVASKA